MCASSEKLHKSTFYFFELVQIQVVFMRSRVAGRGGSKSTHISDVSECSGGGGLPDQ